MFSSFNDAVFEHIQSTVPAGAPVSRRRLGQTDIPEPVGRFLQQMLDRRIAIMTDALDDIGDGWVEDRAADVVEGRRVFAEVLRENGQFPVEEWPRSLRQAVERVVSYLVRPVPTLTVFLFGDETAPVSREDLGRRSRYFVGYDYLRRALAASIDRGGSGPVERRELAEALEREERTAAARWTAAEWVLALEPLARLASAAGLPGVPLPMLDAFFEAKDAPLMAGRVQAYGKRHGLAALDSRALEAALADPRPEDARPQEPARRSGGSGAVPLWQQFRSDGAGPAPERPAPSAGEPLWKRFREPAGDGEPASLGVLERDVLGSAGSKRDEFVRELFAGSEDDYGRLLGRLRAATTWAAASRILGEDLFRRNKIDIYSPAAVDFTNAVEDRYRRDA